MNEYQALQFEECKAQIAAYCRFSLARKMLTGQMPSFSYLWIKQETKRTKEAIECVIRYGMLPLPGLFDISGALKDAQKDKTLRPYDLNRIAQQASCIAAVEQYRRQCEIETPCLDELYGAFTNTDQLAKAIAACINAHDEVMDHASAKLYSLRKSIRLCEGDIAKEAQRFIAFNSNKLTDTITTTRNQRVCVLIKISEKNSVRGFIHGESASGQTAYVEPEALFQLNNKLSSLQSQEQEEVARILMELTRLVKQNSDGLSANQETFTLLDAYFAKAQYAKEHEGCMAHVEPNGKHLYLKELRHPLIDPKQVIANTYELKPPYHVLLITGSNTGGKTVTLKNIGLAACLAQSGMPILAKRAILPFFTQIFIDIGDDQSIQESLSTFSAHISKLAAICDHVSEASLILLDELGSGTDPKEGECLAVAVLDELCASQAFILATTHFHALKSYAKKQDHILVSGVEFDVDQMKPTYRYLEGVSGASNALAIARRYHMKEQILQKAQALREESQSDQERLMEKLEQEANELEQRKAQMEATLNDVQELRKSLTIERERFEKMKERTLAEIKERYEAQLSQTVSEAEALLDQLKQLPQDVKPHILAEAMKQLSDIQIEQEEEQTKDIEFKIGDRVSIRHSHTVGEIIELKKDKACLLVNGLRMNTKQNDLILLERGKPKKQTREKGYQLHKTNTHFSTELNVIGMKVAEALPVVDKYLDNAILNKVYSVRIIHGNGTGALRTGIHQYLKKDPKVEDYRLGGQGEGGMGATVVTLRKAGKRHG